LLRRVLIEDSPTRFDTVSSRNMKRQRERYYELIRARNEVFDEKKMDIIGKRSAQELQRTRMINILDTISFQTDYQNLVVIYFCTSNKSQMLETELSIHIYTLCYWAVTNHRAGDYRVYSVCTILDIWKKELVEAEERFRRQNLIQNSLMEFLDNYPFGNNGICEQEESEVISRLFGELICNGHFSHQRYLQRLIARGDMIKEKRESE
ncbi:7791_t:CDS:2, partial [Acaulospora morrowiae]